MELSIDTSSATANIALSHKGEILALLIWQTARNHTIELLPNLICLLQQAKVELGSIEAIIVAKGPGSFNGLRVGISTAKGLASALNIPLLWTAPAPHSRGWSRGDSHCPLPAKRW